MKNAKKMLIGMLVIVILLMLFPGCRNTQNPADGGSNGKKTVISFAGWGSLAEKKVFTAMIDQFEKKHEGVKVNYQHIPGTQADYLVTVSYTHLMGLISHPAASGDNHSVCYIINAASKF